MPKSLRIELVSASNNPRTLSAPVFCLEKETEAQAITRIKKLLRVSYERMASSVSDEEFESKIILVENNDESL